MPTTDIPEFKKQNKSRSRAASRLLPPLFRFDLIGAFQDDLRLVLVEFDRAGDVDGLAFERRHIGEFARVLGEDHRRERIVWKVAAQVDVGISRRCRVHVVDRALDGHGFADLRLRVGRRNRLRESRRGDDGEAESQYQRFHNSPPLWPGPTAAARVSLTRPRYAMKGLTQAQTRALKAPESSQS